MTDVAAALIQSLVDNQEAVKDAQAVIDANKAVREQLRDVLIEARQVEAIDEVSGYKAILKQNMSDNYVAEKLVPLLRPEEIDTVIQTVVDAKAVQDLVESGALTRRQLEREGALIRTAKTRPFIKLVALKGVRP